MLARTLGKSRPVFLQTICLFVEVGNNQVRQSCAKLFKRIQTVNRHPNDVPGRHQVCRDELPDKGFVVY